MSIGTCWIVAEGRAKRLPESWPNNIQPGGHEGGVLMQLRWRPEVLSLLFPHCRDRLRHVFMNWFTNYAFGSHAAEWLALAVVILLALALCTGTLKFIPSLFTHKRDADESEKDYWRIHGGE